jgi:hypothetical protein
MLLALGVLEIVNVVFKYRLGGGGKLTVVVELEDIMRRAAGQRDQTDDKG